LKKQVEKREIEFILHFTRLENLKSILDNGLKTREYLETNNPEAIFNDDYRYDGFKNSICCSICHPNYKMFFPLRQADPKNEWVVIGIKKDIIWEKDCAFCIENAASNNVTSIPLEKRKGKKAFKKLFKEVKGKPTREKLGINKACPTNPQAEILVFDNISSQDIVGVAFQKSDRVKEYEKSHKGFNFVYHKAFFIPRVDWRDWQ